jgi:hypothetical protein
VNDVFAHYSGFTVIEKITQLHIERLNDPPNNLLLLKSLPNLNTLEIDTLENSGEEKVLDTEQTLEQIHNLTINYQELVKLNPTIAKFFKSIHTIQLTGQIPNETTVLTILENIKSFSSLNKLSIDISPILVNTTLPQKLESALQASLISVHITITTDKSKANAISKIHYSNLSSLAKNTHIEQILLIDANIIDVPKKQEVSLPSKIKQQFSDEEFKQEFRKPFQKNGESLIVYHYDTSKPNELESLKTHNGSRAILLSLNASYVPQEKQKQLWENLRTSIDYRYLIHLNFDDVFLTNNKEFSALKPNANELPLLTFNNLRTLNLDKGNEGLLFSIKAPGLIELSFNSDLESVSFSQKIRYIKNNFKYLQKLSIFIEYDDLNFDKARIADVYKYNRQYISTLFFIITNLPELYQLEFQNDEARPTPFPQSKNTSQANAFEFSDPEEDKNSNISASNPLKKDIEKYLKKIKAFYSIEQPIFMNLEKLSIQFPLFSPKLFAFLLKQCPMLKDFSVASIFEFTAIANAEFSDLKYEYPSIKQLSLDHINLSAGHWDDIIEALLSISHLTSDSCQILEKLSDLTDESVDSLAKYTKITVMHDNYTKEESHFIQSLPIVLGEDVNEIEEESFASSFIPDADTTFDPETTLQTRVYFRDENNQPVSTNKYRLSVAHTTVFPPESSYLNLPYSFQLCNAKDCIADNTPIEKITAESCTDKEKHKKYFGTYELKNNNLWQALPSIDPSEIIEIECPQDFLLKKCKEHGLYYIKIINPNSINIVIKYTIVAPPIIVTPVEPSINFTITRNDFASNHNFKNFLERCAKTGETEAGRKNVINALLNYCSNFKQDNSSHPRQDLIRKNLLRILHEQVGSCRHRCFVLKIIVDYLCKYFWKDITEKINITIATNE